MRIPRSGLYFFVALAVCTGCGGSAMHEAKAAAAPSYAEAVPADAPASQGAPSPAPSPPPKAPSAPGFPSAPGQAPRGPSVTATPAPTSAPAKAKPAPSVRAAVIIYQGDLRMESTPEDVAKTIDRIIDVAESVGGNLSGRKDNSVQIKVPSASFRDALTKIDALGGVTSRSVSADDVSEEFHDLEVRLTNLKATRARLQEFLAKAGAINDMLTVERELERVAQEIDHIEGRLEFLRTRAAMSTINVAIDAKAKSVAVVATDPTKPKQATLDLPIAWIHDVGIDPLLSLHSK